MKTIGAKIDKLQVLREARKELEAQAKAIKEESDVIEAELMEQMNKEGVTKSSGRLATASINDTEQPQVENWDEFYAFIHKKKFYHLLQRRVSSEGCRELFEGNKSIPGVTKFIKHTLNLRVI